MYTFIQCFHSKLTTIPGVEGHCPALSAETRINIRLWDVEERVSLNNFFQAHSHVVIGQVSTTQNEQKQKVAERNHIEEKLAHVFLADHSHSRADFLELQISIFTFFAHLAGE